MKTKIMKAIALCLALVLCFGSAISVSAAEVADAPIDESQKGSLTIFKYDLTGSENAGIWDSSYVSTGVADESGVNETMKNYALEGVEFSFVKVADIVQYTESTADNRTDNHVEVLYAIDKVQGADFLKALGLENGAQRYANVDTLDSSKYFYQSDVLIQALSAALTANSTVVKNAMEQYIAAIGGTAMPLTDSFGKTKTENLELGLYLIVETKVPENVVSTTDPFLISLPMTSVNGTSDAERMADYEVKQLAKLVMNFFRDVPVESARPTEKSIQLNPAMSMTGCTETCSIGTFSYRHIRISMPVRVT